MSKIAILGGSGFIGHHLMNELKGAFGVSMRDSIWSEQILKNVEVLINLVGKAHDHKGTATEVDYYNVNVELVKQIFKVFIKSDAKLFIHISSIAAIEEFESNTALNETLQCHPISYYGRSKRAAEVWLLEQALPENKKLIIVRPPMVHGYGDKGNLGLLYNLISQGIPYPLSSFDNKRSFISIDNFNYFINKIIDKSIFLQSGIYHIADDEAVSTKQIIGVIKSITGKKVHDLSIPQNIVKFLAKIGDLVPFPLNTNRLKKMTSNLLVSNKKIKSALNIDKLPLTAEEGLTITIKSFKQNT